LWSLRAGPDLPGHYARVRRIAVAATFLIAEIIQVMSINYCLKNNRLKRLINSLSIIGLIVSAAVLMPAVAQNAAPAGENAWITDQFEVTMRNGKSNKQAIVRMLSSGTKLEVLERDEEAGYAFVRSRSGAEGWVLTRYLLRRPPARVTLPNIEAQLAKGAEERKKLNRDLRGVREENAALKRQLNQTESSGDDLQRELARISSLSSNTVQIDAENRQFKEALAETQQALEDSRDESRRLASRSNREWFVIGALVVMFGILVGLIVPRIRWKKKSSWGEL
jgi:SH3 domain protein